MFVSQDMRNWKRCYGTTVRDNKLMQHQVSLQLADCVDAYAQYQTVKSGCFQSVAELKNSAHAKLISENRICLRTVCEVLLSLLNGKIAQHETGRSFRADDINKDTPYGTECFVGYHEGHVLGAN